MKIFFYSYIPTNTSRRKRVSQSVYSPGRKHICSNIFIYIFRFTSPFGE